MACGILVPWPGIKPVPPAMEAQSLNHWTTREVPNLSVLISNMVTIHKYNLLSKSTVEILNFHICCIHAPPPSFKLFRIFPIKKKCRFFHWIINFCLLTENLIISTCPLLFLHFLHPFYLINCHPFIKTELYQGLMPPSHPSTQSSSGFMDILPLFLFFSLVMVNLF